MEIMEYKGIIDWGLNPVNSLPNELYYSFKQDEFGNKICYVWVENKWIEMAIEAKVRGEK